MQRPSLDAQAGASQARLIIFVAIHADFCCDKFIACTVLNSNLLDAATRKIKSAVQPCR
jgi:hypothetical protein